MSTIVLLTDFGSRDPYVGVMKCVIDSIAPRAKVIDLAHDIDPQDVVGGAHALLSARAYLPKGAIVVAVVDPGVGSRRRAIAAETKHAIWVGPDNGLFGPVFEEDRPRRIVELTNEQYFLPEVSATFHGRDIFSPVAAHLAVGVKLSLFGPKLERFVDLDLPKPTRDGGVIVAFDRYGNALTNISAPVTATRIRVGRRTMRIARTYADALAGRAIALMSSTGKLEIAVNGGNAEKELGLSRGDSVKLER